MAPSFLKKKKEKEPTLSDFDDLASDFDEEQRLTFAWCL